MLSLNLIIILTINLFSLGLILYCYRKGSIAVELKAVFAILLLLSVFSYTNQFSFFTLFPKDYYYRSTEGNKPLKSYTHWHEIFHYYLGGKYFEELGYNGLYETVLLADTESIRPQSSKNYIRSLREPTYPITREVASERAIEEFRPNFTEDRWKEFRGDVEALKNVAANGWLDLALFDAGYNPPPTWAVFGTNLANLIPIQQDEAFFEARPNWYQLEFLPLFDLAMLLILLFTIYKYFGFLPFATFSILFCTSYVAGASWISGSLLRYTWFFTLSMGIIYLIKGKYELAGIFLGISTMDRIFPVIFATGAGLNLLFNYLKTIETEDFKKLLRYSASFLATILIMFLISIAQFAFDKWQGFTEKIEKHNSMFFVHHIGYKRLAVYDSETTPSQNFWWEDGLDRFRSWNDSLNEKWQNDKFFHYIVFAVIIAACMICISSISAAESALIFGGVILYLFAIPANYYYIYFPLISLVILTQNYSKFNYFILSLPFILWIYTRLALLISNDDLVQNYYICIGFFIFFLLWIGLRVFENVAGNKLDCNVTPSS